MGKKVLFVDDDSAMRQAFPSILRDKGHEVEVASTEDEAISLASEKDFDVVITDWNLTGYGSGWGTGVIRRIRDMGKSPRFALMSSDRGKAEPLAVELGVRFIQKTSKGLLREMLDFIAE